MFIRTQFGIITFDSEIHFYDLSGGSKGLAGPKMLVVSDLTTIFRPVANDLLVDVVERRDAIESLLDALPMMHSSNASRSNDDAALGNYNIC